MSHVYLSTREQIKSCGVKAFRPRQALIDSKMVKGCNLPSQVRHLFKALGQGLNASFRLISTYSDYCVLTFSPAQVKLLHDTMILL